MAKTYVIDNEQYVAYPLASVTDIATISMVIAVRYIVACSSSTLLIVAILSIY